MVWLIVLYAVLAILRWMNVCNLTIRLFNSQLSTDLATDIFFWNKMFLLRIFVVAVTIIYMSNASVLKDAYIVFIHIMLNITKYYATIGYTGHTYQNDIIKKPDPSSITKTQGASSF